LIVNRLNHLPIMNVSISGGSVTDREFDYLGLAPSDTS
jgi:hypothetical protein